MRKSGTTRLGYFAVAIAGLLLLAPSALAASIKYDVQQDPAYTVDNTSGLVKVTYNSCLIAGQPQTIVFPLTIDASGDGTAGVNILKEEGVDPNITATGNGAPPPFAIAKGVQTLNVALTVLYPATSATANQFRFKLDPEPGTGLGQGPGVVVRVPCVIPPAAQNTIPSMNSPQARGASPCVSTPRSLVARKGELTTVRVTVATNGQRIKGALVRVTGPGIREQRRTDGNGLVVLRVRPNDTGKITIQSNVCLGADKVAVLGAQRKSRPQQVRPRFTG